jgi:hypothetical protein
MEWLFVGICVVVVWLGVRGMIRLSRPTAGPTRKDGTTSAAMAAATVASVAAIGATGPIGGSEADASDEIDGMNEGDYHSGPAGYSPMTAYPETQYGSGFDEDADWHEEQ